MATTLDRSRSWTRYWCRTPTKTMRRSLLADFGVKGVRPGLEDAWSFSLWRGYLDGEDGQKLHAWFKAEERRPSTSIPAAMPRLRTCAALQPPCPRDASSPFTVPTGTPTPASSLTCIGYSTERCCYYDNLSKRSLSVYALTIHQF